MSAPAGPRGRTAGLLAASAALLLLVSNLVATAFWTASGGLGLLDLDGGANLLQPDPAPAMPPGGTADRVLALVAGYPPESVVIHTVLLLSLDVLTPLAIAATIATVPAWAARGLPRAPRLALTGLALTLAVVSVTADLGENVLELIALHSDPHRVAALLPPVAAVKTTVDGIGFLLALVSAASVAVARMTRARRTDSSP